MADIRVPTLGESVTEATVGKWFKQQGDTVAVDEPLVELETDKVTLEVPAPAAGVLSERSCSRSTTRAPDQTLNSPLGRLFQNALFAEGTTRGLSRAAVNDYALGVLSWQSVPRGK